MSRYFVMSVPDNNDGAFWFVYDRKTRTSVEFATMDAADAACRQMRKAAK